MHTLTTDEPNGFHQLFTFAKPDDVNRITRGKRCLELLDEGERFGLAPHGKPLLGEDAALPDISAQARSQFLWCGPGHLTKRDGPEQFKIPGHRSLTWGDTHVVNVTLHTFSEVYVADHGPYRRWRNHFRQIMGEQNSTLTDDQILHMQRARARTLVALSLYDGGYSAPIYLVRRNLELAEVSVVSGPWLYKNGNYRLIKH